MIIEENSKDVWSGKPTPKGTTIVIDGDWLAFVGACMTHVNHFVATDPVTEKELFAVTTEKAVQKELKALGLTEDSVILVTEKRLIDNWEATAKGVMIGKANKLKRECGGNNILIAIGREN